MTSAAQRRFRFGAALPPAPENRQAFLDEVRRAAGGGFAIATVSDHFRGSGGIFPSLIAAYDAAPELRVGTLVLNNDFWHPTFLAREVITADALTDGAFELGIGAGWDEPDYRAMGMERPAPGRRIEKLGEAIGILRSALSGEAVEFRGNHYTVEGGAIWPKPREGRVPLVVGGGSRRILELAGREADIVSLHRNLEHGVAASWVAETRPREEHPDPVSERVSWVRAAAGSRFEAIELHALILKAVVTDDRMRAAEELGRPHGLGAEQVLEHPNFLAGTVEQMAADLAERRSRWGISYWTLSHGNNLDAFAPVIARLAGS